MDNLYPEVIVINFKKNIVLKILTLFTIILFTILSCKNENVDGIIIGDTLFIHQSVSENSRMEKLIKKALKNDKSAILELTEFPNGGAASSYDLGFVITQIIYRIGEENFAKSITELQPKNLANIEGLIGVGLEYGDNNYDGEMDETRIENEFPKLHQILSEKN